MKSTGLGRGRGISKCQIVELWLEGAAARIEGVPRVPPVKGELITGRYPRVRYLVLRVDPARPRESVPMRVVVERVE